MSRVFEPVTSVLQLWLSTREDRGTSEEDNWSDLRQQERLHEMFIAHELRLFQGASWEWRGELSPAARAILHQHAIQGDVTDLQLALVRFVAFVRTAVTTPLDHGLILKLLHDLEDQWDSGPLSREEVRHLDVVFSLNILDVVNDVKLTSWFQGVETVVRLC